MRVEGLTVRFGDRVVLHDLSFDLTSSRRVAVMGTNGSGKSALLLAMARLVPSDARVLDTSGPIGIVFQDPEVGWTAPTVEEEIRFSLACGGVREELLSPGCERMLSRFELENLRGRRPDTLSGGEQQRLQLAAVMATSPRTLLLDEPTEYLDPGAAKDLDARLDALEPDLVIRATHDTETASLCDRLLVLDRGRLVANGPPRDVLSSPGWTDWMGGLGGASVAARIIAEREPIAPPMPITWEELGARCR